MQAPVLSKVTDGAAYGVPAAMFIAWLVSLAGVEIPAPIVAALAALIPPVISYFAPERRAHIGVRG